MWNISITAESFDRQAWPRLCCSNKWYQNLKGLTQQKFISISSKSTASQRWLQGTIFLGLTQHYRSLWCCGPSISIYTPTTTVGREENTENHAQLLIASTWKWQPGKPSGPCTQTWKDINKHWWYPPHWPDSVFKLPPCMYPLIIKTMHVKIVFQYSFENTVSYQWMLFLYLFLFTITFYMMSQVLASASFNPFSIIPMEWLDHFLLKSSTVPHWI